MIFIDSSAFVAYYNKRDEHHGEAAEVFEEISSRKFGEAVSSDYILDESVTVTLVRTGEKERAVELGDHIMKSTNLLKVHSHTFKEAWKIFKENNLGLSFTDCTNLALMGISDIEKIATFDRAFEDVEGIKVIK